MLPRKIIVRVTGDFRPGMVIGLRFGMSRKNDFYYRLYLDEDGQAQVERDELLRAFDEDRNMFLMDYAEPRAFFSGEIEAHVLTKEEIEAAIRAYDTFKIHWDYPPDYLSNLRKALTINPESRCILSVEQIP